MKKQIKLLIFTSTICFYCSQSFGIEKIRVPEYQKIKILIEGETPKKEYTDLVLTIKDKYIRKRNRQIPKNFERAVELLESWLSPDVLNQITSEKGLNKPFQLRNESFYDLSHFLFELWHLDSDNELSFLFQKKGILLNVDDGVRESTNTIWFLEALFEGIYQKRLHGSVNTNEILNRIGSYASINAYDTVIRPYPPPKNCSDNRILFKDVFFEDKPPYLASRIISWVKCDNDTVMAFLWEEGWFTPNPDLLKKITNED